MATRTLVSKVVRSSSLLRLRPLISSTSPLLHLSSIIPYSFSRNFSSQPTTSSLSDPSPNWSNRPPKETILLDGCDFEHWLVIVDPPEPTLTRDEIIDYYLKTAAEVVGSEEEARMAFYSVSTKHYFGFGIKVDEETSYKFKALPKVRWVLPDSYLDVRNKDYGGEPVCDGQFAPYDPKYHAEWVQNNARANERSRRNDRPRNADRSRNFERRRENMQSRDFQNAPPTSNPGFQNAPPMPNPGIQNRDAPPMPNPGFQNNPNVMPQQNAAPPMPNRDFGPMPNSNPNMGSPMPPPQGSMPPPPPPPFNAPFPNQFPNPNMPSRPGYQGGGSPGYQGSPAYQRGGLGYQGGNPGGNMPGGPGYQGGNPGGNMPGGPGYQGGDRGNMPGGTGHQGADQGYQGGPSPYQGGGNNYQGGGGPGYQGGNPSYQTQGGAGYPGGSPNYQEAGAGYQGRDVPERDNYK